MSAILFSTDIMHSLAAGMGGMRTAGDLVLRMQLTHKMKINDAKKYVAEKLGVSLMDLSDVVTMTELRTELGIGIVQPYDGANVGMEAKFRISELLGVKINSVERFKERSGIK